jgi:hypothetical protein
MYGFAEIAGSKFAAKTVSPSKLATNLLIIFRGILLPFFVFRSARVHWMRDQSFDLNNFTSSGFARNLNSWLDSCH